MRARRSSPARHGAAQQHAAVDLGRLRREPRLCAVRTDGVDQHRELASDQRGLLLGEDPALEREQALVAIARDRARHLVREVEGRGALFVRVAEAAEPVEARLAHEVAELLEVRFGLARESHDHGGAQRQLRDLGAQLLDQASLPIGGDAAPHRAQQAVARVLERNVDVGQQAAARRQHFDQLVRHGRRIDVEQADPFQAFGLRRGGAAGARAWDARGDPSPTRSGPARPD